MLKGLDLMRVKANHLRNCRELKKSTSDFFSVSLRWLNEPETKHSVIYLSFRSPTRLVKLGCKDSIDFYEFNRHVQFERCCNIIKLIILLNPALRNEITNAFNLRRDSDESNRATVLGELFLFVTTNQSDSFSIDPNKNLSNARITETKYPY